MPATHHIDNKAKLIITFWEGDATDTECLEVLKEYQKNIQCNPDYVNYNEVFDLTNAAKIRVSISGLINIGSIASKTDHLFTNKKLALITSSNITFHFLRMYEYYRNFGVSSCKKIHVFRNKDEAYAWVKSNK